MPNITRLNWVDVVALIIMLRISYVAFEDGLSHEIFPLVGTTAALVLGLHYYAEISTYIIQIVRMKPELADFIGFFLIIVAMAFTLKLLRAVIDKIISIEWHPFLERVGGLSFGIIKASLITSIVLIMFALLPLPYFQRSIRDRSLSGMYFIKIGPNIYEKVVKFLPTIKAEKAPIDREAMVQRLVADKSILPKFEGKPKISEWEKL